MTIQAETLIKKIENFAPLFLKEGNDPTGFQLGNRESTIKRVLVTLDVRPEVVKEAIDQHVDFIFSHHPLLFHPIKKFDLADPQNQMYADLLKHDITVYSAHTNLDKTNGGMNDWLAEAMNLSAIHPFALQSNQNLRKLIVVIPTDHADQMREALAKIGAGALGNYRDASFSSKGITRFMPEKGSNPSQGEINKLTQTEETKLEVIFERDLTGLVVETMLDNHPYELPAYDLIDLANEGPEIGIGRIGTLSQSVSVLQFAEEIKETFGLTGLRLVSNHPGKMIQKVAVIGGDGGKFYHEAIKAGADAFVTGDVYYHTAHDMLADGLSVIDPGHHIESIIIEKMTTKISQWSKENDWGLEVVPSQINTEPYRFI